ncbi:hypothetical protein GOODEAATRI_029871 [Goodea atripinnis]|uniref:Uncharacterized protein n=1 Tax=Goodea atripinnis TaxID=208336 RepID=A0ABV0P8Y9_9TELE
MFLDFALCTVAHLCWNRKGTSKTVSTKAWRMKLSKMFWYAKALRAPSIGNKRLNPTPEKQPNTIILPPPNFTLDTVQPGKCCSSGNCQTQTHSLDFQTERHDSSLQRTCLHCSRMQRLTPLHLIL